MITSINEFKNKIINNKWIVGKFIDEGRESKVYSLENEPDKVIKLRKPNMRLEYNRDTQLMLKNPDIFVKIYDYGDNFMVIDRVDCDKVIDDLYEIYDNAPGGNDISTEDDCDILISYFSNLMRNIKFYDIAKKFHDFFTKIKKVKGDAKWDISIHPHNYGYDKSGNLKQFDI